MCGLVLFLHFSANFFVFLLCLHVVGYCFFCSVQIYLCLLLLFNYVCLGIVSLCVFTVFWGLFLYFCANFFVFVFTVYVCESLCPNFFVILLGLRVFFGVCFFISVLICVWFLLLLLFLLLSRWFLFFLFFFLPLIVFGDVLFWFVFMSVLFSLHLFLLSIHVFGGYFVFILTGCWKTISHFVFMLICFSSCDGFIYVYTHLSW